jgi:ParB family chromosome partitioning protein
MLGWPTIGVVIEERPLSPPEVALRQLIENSARIDPSPLDVARCLADTIQETEWSQKEAAERTGFSTGTVSRLLALLDLPDAIQRQVAAGAIAASTAYEISRVADPTEQAELADQAAKGNLTRENVSGKAPSGKRNANGHAAARLLRVKAPLGAGRSITIAGPALTLELVIDWLEELLCKAREAQGLDLNAFVKTLRAGATAAAEPVGV